MLLTESSHRRYNPLTGEWVLVSPHRTKRPWQGKTEKSASDERPSYDPECYLCPGNSRAGGLRNPNYQSTFVFQNDFAAIQSTETKEHYAKGLLLAETECGICKVICFSPDHSLTMAELSVEAILGVISTWQVEFEQLSLQSGIAHVQIFENKGDIMGCSNPHPHGQIWAQSSIPHEIQLRTTHQSAFFKKNRKSLLSVYLVDELANKERIVSENEHFVCLVPFWAIWPYETMIIPKRHFQAVSDMNHSEKKSFAEILLQTTIRYDNLFETSFPYSAGMIQRPTDGQSYEGWHFHYSFYPPLLRSATVKKFMVGYEMFASPQRDITPEQAAQKLRSLDDIHYKTRQVVLQS